LDHTDEEVLEVRQLTATDKDERIDLCCCEDDVAVCFPRANITKRRNVDLHF
jgi:hypothetical protein